MTSRRFHTTTLLLLVALLRLLASAEDGEEHHECVYTVYVRTGSVIGSGTDAKIGLSLGDGSGREVQVADLVSWGGLMDPDHDYFERGNLDAFSGQGPCGLSTPLCRLNVSSDGGGAHHGWYCEYVEVTTTGPHLPCSKTLFYVRQWLATDAPPFQLYVAVDSCDHGSAPRGTPFVVGNSTGTHYSSSSI